MMSSAGDDLGAMDPGLGPAPSRDEDAAPAVWSQFLAPEPFRDVDPSLYRIETTASPAAAVEAWVTAQPLAPSDSTAALVVDRAETRLRTVAPDQMAAYDRLRSEGREPLDAMRAAAPAAGGVGRAAEAADGPPSGPRTPRPFGPWDSLSSEAGPSAGLGDDVAPQAPGRQLEI